MIFYDGTSVISITHPDGDVCVRELFEDHLMHDLMWADYEWAASPDRWFE